MYIVSLLIHIIVILVIIGIIFAFGLRIPNIWFISLLFVLANPMWICAFACFLGLIRLKKSLVITGTLSGSILIFLLINSTTAIFWYTQSLHNTAKTISLIFCWLPTANYISSIISALIYQQVISWDLIQSSNKTPLGPYGA